MSKIGKIFGSSIFKAIAPLSPLATIFAPRKKKTVFINLAPKAKTPDEAVKRTSETEGAERRFRVASKLKRGVRTDASVAKINNEDEEDVIRRAAARRAKLLGS